MQIDEAALDSKVRSIIRKGVMTGCLALIAMSVFFSGYYTVQEQERAVLTRFGQYVETAGPGFHLKLPFVHGVTLRRIDIQSVSPKAAVNTYTIDSQELDAVFTVLYRTPADQVEFVYRNVPDLDQRVLGMAIDRFKVEVGKVNVSNFAEQRGQIRDRIKAILTADARALGAELSRLRELESDLPKARAANERMAAQLLTARAAGRNEGLEEAALVVGHYKAPARRPDIAARDCEIYAAIRALKTPENGGADV